MQKGSLLITAFESLRCYRCGKELGWKIVNKTIEVDICDFCIGEKENEVIEKIQSKYEERKESRD